MKGSARLALTVPVLLAASAALASIANSKHNLSVSSPGDVRAAAEKRICVFCHTPHSANPQAPLWNREQSGVSYEMYWSPTLDAYSSSGSAPQPNGSSKLCLSCHDGSIALGSTTATGTIAMAGGISTMPGSSRSFLGRDLSGDHPVSFRVTQELIDVNNAKGDVPLKGLLLMQSDPDVRLDSQSRIQCASCHDPHDDSHGYFLVKPTVGELCVACHF
jgi:predicted CXXCH cytochrome family protein